MKYCTCRRNPHRDSQDERRRASRYSTRLARGFEDLSDDEPEYDREARDLSKVFIHRRPYSPLGSQDPHYRSGLAEPLERRSTPPLARGMLRPYAGAPRSTRAFYDEPKTGRRRPRRRHRRNRRFRYNPCRRNPSWEEAAPMLARSQKKRKAAEARRRERMRDKEEAAKTEKRSEHDIKLEIISNSLASLAKTWENYLDKPGAERTAPWRYTGKKIDDIAFYGPFAGSSYNPGLRNDRWYGNVLNTGSGSIPTGERINLPFEKEAFESKHGKPVPVAAPTNLAVITYALLEHYPEYLYEDWYNKRINKIAQKMRNDLRKLVEAYGLDETVGDVHERLPTWPVTNEELEREVIRSSGEASLMHHDWQSLVDDDTWRRGRRFRRRNNPWVSREESLRLPRKFHRGVGHSSNYLHPEDYADAYGSPVDQAELDAANLGKAPLGPDGEMMWDIEAPSPKTGKHWRMDSIAAPDRDTALSIAKSREWFSQEPREWRGDGPLQVEDLKAELEDSFKHYTPSDTHLCRCDSLDLFRYGCQCGGRRRRRNRRFRYNPCSSDHKRSPRRFNPEFNVPTFKRSRPTPDREPDVWDRAVEDYKAEWGKDSLGESRRRLRRRNPGFDSLFSPIYKHNPG